MAFEIMDSIRQAEQKAEAMRLDAQMKGREIIKACEEACALEEKSSEQDIRARYTAQMDERRRQVENMIASKAKDKQKEMDATLQKAEALLPKAAQMIVERVLNHGDR